MFVVFNDDNNVEQILQQDNQEKKRTGYGAIHKAPRSGGVRGVLKTPYNMMDSRQKREYIKNNTGEVVKYYMDEKDITLVKSIEDIKALPYSEARDYIIRVKNAYTAKELVKRWGLKTDYHLYQKLYKEYDVPTDKGRMEAAKAAIKAKKNLDLQYAQTVGSTADKAEETAPAATAAIPEISLEPTKMTLSLSGTFSGEELETRILKLVGALEKTSSYKCYVSLTE